VLQEKKMIVKNKFIAPVLIAILVSIIILSIINGCQHEVVDKKNLRKIIFETEILPIFLNNCLGSGCHDGSGEAPLDLSNYNGIMQGIVKGNPSSSRIYSAITATYFNLMPPSGALQPSDRAKIRLWIEQGAEDTKPDTINPINTTKVPIHNVCFARDILPVVQANCAVSGCHDNTTAASGIKLTSYENIKDFVNAGNPESSMIYTAMVSNTGNRMPPLPRNPMSKANVDSIYKWIKSGAIYSICDDLCDTNNFNFLNDIFPIFINYCNTCHPVYNDSVTIKNLIPGNLLSDVLTGLNNHSIMPPSGPLGTCKITQIKKWMKTEAISTCDTSKYNYVNDVVPILNANCIICHSDFSDSNQFKKRLLNNKLISALTATNGVSQMPPSGLLDACNINKIKNWARTEDISLIDTTPIQPPVTESYPVCFARDIFPVIQAGCVASGCHNDASAAGDISLTSYAYVRQIVRPGNPLNSKLYRVITNSGEDQMPPYPKNPLSKANVDSIYNWIKNGATDDVCKTICNSNKFGFTADIFPLINNRCNTCHSFTNYTIIYNLTLNNVLIDRLNGANGKNQMPPSGKLDTCSIRKVENWIKYGALQK
jgi:cytochrome c5